MPLLRATGIRTESSDGPANKENRVNEKLVQLEKIDRENIKQFIIQTVIRFLSSTVGLDDAGRLVVAGSTDRRPAT